ncbi:MAG: histidine phosphatase family protein [Crocinitomicaceae bacterium]|nr:histidine phosphatase family protein [Crocinitomicaceae bacterium]MBK8926244.1 histidine phosphatase family protein [Crocinitomicaceae bacterium]
MKPNKLFLVRHGESEGNVNKSIYAEKPDYTLELTEAGKNQAYEAGKRLKAMIGDETVFFYVSPMWRTRTTFEEIAKSFDKSKITYREEPRIREQEWGHLRTQDESKIVEKARDAYGTFYYRIPDGESAADVYDRISDFFGTLHRDFLKSDFPQNTVIITHGMAIRLFLMKWFHWTVEEFELLANPSNCAIVEFVRDDTGKYKLISDVKKWDSTFHNYSRPVKID